MNRAHRSSSLPAARAIALLAPALLLGGALLSQYVGGLYPCEMCLWQRWPHLAAILLALAAFALRGRAGLSRLLVALAALAIALSGAIGAFHAGVEYGWWEGVTACSVSMGGGSAQDMLDAIMAAPITRCDVAPWSLLGISLAGYNALLSLGAALLIALLLRRQKDKA
ncbi:MAG: disulfide bond formation protein B [Sphingobium sp.]